MSKSSAGISKLPKIGVYPFWYMNLRLTGNWKRGLHLAPLEMARAALLGTSLATAALCTAPPSLADGTTVASFTYSCTTSVDSQQSCPGNANGTVYSLSVNGSDLALCTSTPNNSTESTTSVVPYQVSCLSTLATNNAGNYSAVTFLGTTNGTNPNYYFAVGDTSGNVTVMQPTYYLNDDNIYVATNVKPIQTLKVAGGGCQVTSLAIDPSEGPNGQYLYVGCTANSGSNGPNPVAFVYGNVTYSLGGAFLAKAKINLNNDGGITTNPLNPITYVTGIYPVSGGVSGVAATAAYWNTQNKPKCCSAVNPRLRMYPAQFTGLMGSSAYYSTGGVLYTGLIGSINSYGKPVNSALFCYSGQCEQAYNLALSDNPNKNSSDFYVITSAEYGVMNDATGAPTQGLYWNEVQAKFYLYGSTPNHDYYYEANMPGKPKLGLIACPLADPIGFTATNASACQSAYPLSWPPPGIPSSTVWIDQMVYLPRPDNGPSSSYVNGLLMLGTWNNGYLAYYDPVAGSTSVGKALTQTPGEGEIGGNVYSLNADTNGNVMMQAGGQGLFAMNPFLGNLSYGTDTILIPIAADFQGGGGWWTACGSSSKSGLQCLAATTSIIFNGVKFAGRGSALATPASSSPPSAAFPSQNRSVSSMTQASAKNQGTDWPQLALERPLGSGPSWNEYTWTENQMADLGVKPGTVIRGLKLRLPQGVSRAPKHRLRFQEYRIAMNGQVVRSGPLKVAKESYGRSSRNRYGPKIGFDHRFVYLGGNLTMSLAQTGTSYECAPFYLEAWSADAGSGKYTWQVTPGGEPIGPLTEIGAVPVIKFITATR